MSSDEEGEDERGQGEKKELALVELDLPSHLPRPPPKHSWVHTAVSKAERRGRCAWERSEGRLR